jgi:general secretion pathway protein E
VFSTLHTNSAVGAVTRLRDMGVEPFLLASSLIGVLAQRLVRVLCADCKEAYVAGEAECAELGVDPAMPPTLYRARGCPQCNELGYRGRTGIYEMIELDNSMRTMIHDGASEHELEQYARRFTPGMRQDGNRRALAGVTTLEEVVRVSREG